MIKSRLNHLLFIILMRSPLLQVLFSGSPGTGSNQRHRIYPRYRLAKSQVLGGSSLTEQTKENRPPVGGLFSLGSYYKNATYSQTISIHMIFILSQKSFRIFTLTLSFSHMFPGKSTDNTNGAACVRA